MAINGTFSASLPGANTYWGLTPISAPPQEISTPTAEQLSKEGGTTYSGRERAAAGQFRFIERNSPTVEFRVSSVYNSMAAQEAAYALDGMRQRNAFELKLDYGKRSVNIQGTKLNDIYQSLLDLRMRSGTLQNPATYNLKSSSPYPTGTVSANAAANAPAGTRNVAVTQLAKSQQMASSVYADPAAPLGLTGTFAVNGWTVTVTAADTLDTLRDKINYGTDTDHNGTVDYGNDVNGNGRLDVLTARGGGWDGKRYTPSFYLNEDSAGNGTVTPTEDTFGTKGLVGGPASTGVKAAVAGGQLVLTAQTGANIDLLVNDPNRVLESMGFYLRNPNTYETAVNRFNTQSVDAQDAQLAVDGKLYTGPQNSITTADGLALTLNKTGKVKVTVQDNPDQVLAPVSDFGNAFNNAMDLMNRTIVAGDALADNVRLQTVYSDTVRAFYTAPPTARGGLRSVAELGVSAPSEPTAISQTLLENLPDMASQETLASGVGPLSFFNQTGRIGINSPDNFKMSLDRDAIKKKILQNPSAVGEMLNYAAGRLQARLDVHLNPDYGTIKLQQVVVGFYGKNQDEVGKLMSETAGVAGTAVNRSAQNNLFQTVETNPAGFSVTV